MENLPIKQDKNQVDENKKMREHKGLPLLTREEFSKLYYTSSDENTSKTFNYQGYLEQKDGSIFYLDRIATNNVKTASNSNEKGAHIGIDGIESYRNSILPLQDPSQVGEYNIYIKIPYEMQKQEGVVCRDDDCISVSKYIENAEGYGSNLNEILEEIDEKQRAEDYIVVRCSTSPEDLPDARDRILKLNEVIIDYFKKGYDLGSLSKFIYAVDELLAEGCDYEDKENLVRGLLPNYAPDGKNKPVPNW